MSGWARVFFVVALLWVTWACLEEQVANAGAQKWDYCAPKANYADVRKRVGNAFAEKANEIADAIAVVQGLSKEATRRPHSTTDLLCVAPAVWGLELHVVSACK